jgi:hypothetical protein
MVVDRAEWLYFYFAKSNGFTCGYRDLLSYCKHNGFRV